MNTRMQWRMSYREARKADRFYGVMRHVRGVKVTSMFGTLDLCPRYQCSRLFGDSLHTYAGHQGMVTHRVRMNELSRRVRLPS